MAGGFTPSRILRAVANEEERAAQIVRVQNRAARLQASDRTVIPLASSVSRFVGRRAIATVRVPRLPAGG